MKFPNEPIKGVPVVQTMTEVIDFLRPQPGIPKGRPLENFETWDTLPPFLPILSEDNDGYFKFTLTDGYVIERVPGTVDAIEMHIPSGISYLGERTAIAITPSFPQISIRIETNPDGEIYSVSYVLDTEGQTSVNPDENTSTYGDIRIKLAVFRPASGGDDAYLELYAAGSHIYYSRGDVTGLTGYVKYVRDLAGGGTSYSYLYVRYINGQMVATLDGWNGSSAVTPPAGWGSQIYAVEFFGAAGYGPPNSNW